MPMATAGEMRDLWFLDRFQNRVDIVRLQVDSPEKNVTKLGEKNVQEFRNGIQHGSVSPFLFPSKTWKRST